LDLRLPFLQDTFNSLHVLVASQAAMASCHLMVTYRASVAMTVPMSVRVAIKTNKVASF
jgi:hypothetical protein